MKAYPVQPCITEGDRQPSSVDVSMGHYSRRSCLVFGHGRFQALALFCLLLFHLALVEAAGKNYYEILGVAKDASTAAIKKAYRKLSVQYHPDRNSDPGAGDKFSEIAAAYEVLSHNEKRQIYDHYGEEGLQQHEQGPGPADFFSVFGFGQRHSSKGKQKAETTYTKLYLSLAQLYFGELLHVSFNRPVLCIRADECTTTKKECSGPGIATITQSFGPGFVIQNQIQDETCVDREKKWKTRCSACPNGPTELQAAKTSIYVEPGMHDGEVLTFEGGGIQKLGFDPGDVVFRIVQSPHESFTRHDADLFTTVYITLTEALIGFSKTFAHVNRQPLVLTKSTVTHDGEVEILRGSGMPRRAGGRSGVGYGDLHVTYRVQYPVALSDEAKSLVTQALSDVSEWKFQVPVLS